jgi:SAM-dependent methyltransferase
MSRIVPNLPEIDYDSFDHTKYPIDYKQWGLTPENFYKVIDEAKPSLIIEVGTWKGESAIFMAEYIREKNLNTKIICIDTWLGSCEHLNLGETILNDLRFDHGYPSIYYQFLANVKHLGLENIIEPFPTTSFIGWEHLYNHNIRAELIFIDSSHEENQAYQDVQNYFTLLKNKGSILFGDDYTWASVANAVNKFGKERNLAVENANRNWIIRKP